ncbi:MAG TPA: CdaR family protein [Thermodesulfobacteriota bacterium]
MLRPHLRRVRRGLRENWQLKILAVVFAVVLWLFVVGEREAEIGLIVPIDLRNIPSGTVVAADVEREAQVRVTGPQTRLASLSPDQVKVSVDVSGASPDHPIRVRLTPSAVTLPSGINLVRLTPPEIEVRLDPITRRRVPVEASIVGAPEAGLEVKGWRVEPPAVDIVGGTEAVARIEAVRTVDVDVAGAVADLEREVPLEAPAAGVRLDGPAVVQVQVRIGRDEP